MESVQIKQNQIMSAARLWYYWLSSVGFRGKRQMVWSTYNARALNWLSAQQYYKIDIVLSNSTINKKINDAFFSLYEEKNSNTDCWSTPTPLWHPELRTQAVQPRPRALDAHGALPQVSPEGHPLESQRVLVSRARLVWPLKIPSLVDSDLGHNP